MYNLSKPLYLRKSKAIVLCPTCEALLNSNSLNSNNFSTLLNNDSENLKYSRFTELLNKGNLVFVSNELFDYILAIESILAKHITNTIQSTNFLSELCNKVSSEIITQLPQCCNLPNLILQRSVLILSYRYLSSVFKTNNSSEFISYNQSTSKGRGRPTLANVLNHFDE